MSKTSKCYCRNLATVLQSYNRYFSKELSFSTEKVKTTANGKHYHFIPSGSMLAVMRQLSHFVEVLNKFDKPPKFIDCGCGIGNIIMLAEQMGYDCAGIEFDYDTYKIAKKLVNNYIMLHRGDITRFKHYDEYDLIYFYVPIQDDYKMKMFIRKIVRHSKVGAIIYSYSGAYGSVIEESFIKYVYKFERLKMKYDKWSTAFRKTSAT